MPKNVKIRRGADIKLMGAAERIKADGVVSSSYAIKPTDFHGMTPKMALKEGAEVKAGTEIFHDKYNDKIKFVSPVSGEIAEIVRGAKRRILEVRIVADQNRSFESIDVSDQGSEAQIKSLLLRGGFWPMIKQRPYDVIADPTRKPKAIFISAFDSAPLGADYDFVMHGQAEAFQKGVDALAKLTNGKVHLNVRGTGTSDPVFTDVKNVERNSFSGPHPAGNVGVQIHHVSPINKGEAVWTVSPQHVAMIGRFLITGKADFSKTIALAGSEVDKPRYLNVVTGASMKSIVDGQLKEGNPRVISGNVLTGSKVGSEGYLGFYDDVVSCIPEGTEPQFMGWIAPNFHKFSLSRSYFSWLTPSKKYRLNTNQNGEDRAFVVTGEYENVLPMDIYPVHLLKAIMTNDIEKMENLGIYEVAPEDMALCEYTCTSKIPVQEILRKGLDLAQQELG
jgi:Na+-transporting NADH:ubiquinone oxidoreductase subunit A